MHLRNLLCTLALFALATPMANAQGWGTIKGSVVWGGATIPKQDAENVNKDQQACLKKGPILSEKYEIDKDTKGVRWVMVWLVHPKNYRFPVKPIHPALAQPKEKTVSFDQPCCKFIPHVMGMREGQTLIAKNSAGIPHNVFLIGGATNPTINQLVPPGGQHPIAGLKASTLTMPVSCTIHTWMKMYVRCFNHPYFAVTDEKGNFEIKDAPAGDWNIVVWHETGYVVGTKSGTPIKVVSGKTSEVGPFKLMAK